MEGDREPVVSVVMPTYNQAGFLREAVRSVLLQDEPRWELLVINNFSEDDTAAVLEGFSDPRIRREDFRNEGIIAASRNRGVGLARGRFVAFLDSDDSWYPGKLSACLGALERGADAVCHGMLIRKDGIPAGNLVPSPPRSLYDELIFRGNTSIATSSVVIRRECLAKAGGFSEDREIVSAEDYELWLRLARGGARFAMLPVILGEYTVHQGGLSRNIGRQSDAEAEVVTREFRRMPDDSLRTILRKRRRMALLHLRAARRFQQAGLYGEAGSALARSVMALTR